MYESRTFDKLSIAEGLARVAEGEPDRVWLDDRPLYLYGKGDLGKLALEFFDRVGLPIARVFDQGDLSDRLRVGAHVAVAVITSPYAPIDMTLRARGFHDINPFYDVAHCFRGDHPLADNGWYAEPFSDVDLMTIELVLRGWSDDASRAHHLRFLAWRRIREEWVFPEFPVSNDDRYFIPEVVAALGDRERFLDGGAYHGEVSRRFKDIVGGRYGWIVAVEPDVDNSERLTLDRNPPATLGCALWNHEGPKLFHAGFGYASRLDPNGATIVETRTIDSLDLAPTFIKLHLEGVELDALRGGVETLRKHRPIVAATVYHNADGLFRTAQWLMNHLTDYRFLFREHCWQGAGAVVYAIPNERPR